jgi:hypothetical protein
MEATFIGQIFYLYGCFSRRSLPHRIPELRRLLRNVQIRAPQAPQIAANDLRRGGCAPLDAFIGKLFFGHRLKGASSFDRLVENLRAVDSGDDYQSARQG